MSFVLLCKRYLVPLPFHPAPLTWGTPHCPVPQHPAPDAWTLYPQIATTRRLTVHFNPPSSCILEISVRGVKICVRAEDAQEAQVWPPTQVLLALPAQRLLHRLAMATVSPLSPPFTG